MTTAATVSARRRLDDPGHRTLVFTLLAVSCAARPLPAPAHPAPAPSHADVRIEGSRVLVGGRPTTLFGFRVGSAPLREEWTRELIGQLDLWQRHGVNSLILWLQGTSGAFSRVFTADGTRIDPATAPVMVRAGYGLDEKKISMGETNGRDTVARALRIVDAAAARQMVVIVGLIYRHSVLPSDTRETITAAMRAGAAPFADRPNVILHPWNEANASKPLESPADIQVYAQALRAIAPARPICVGSNRQSSNLAYAGLPEIDLLCQDAGKNAAESLRSMNELATFGKPVINVESFEGHGAGYVDLPGRDGPVPDGHACRFDARNGFRRVYGAFEEDDYADAAGFMLAGRRSYRDLIAAVASDPGRQLHVMVHVAGWFQGASRTENAAHVAMSPGGGRWGNVFHTGAADADGTPEKPGLAWILRAIALTRSAQVVSATNGSR